MSLKADTISPYRSTRRLPRSSALRYLHLTTVRINLSYLEAQADRRGDGLTERELTN